MKYDLLNLEPQGKHLDYPEVGPNDWGLKGLLIIFVMYIGRLFYLKVGLGL